MATATAFATRIGVFNTRDAAERAIADLKRAGYRDDQIGLVAKDSSGTKMTDGSGTKMTKGESDVMEGAAIGAVAGAGALAAGSLAISFGVIPVIGPILAIGPLAAALISAAGGAAGGAAAGGVVGALAGWGVPEEDAKYYEGELKAGRFLVTLNRDDDQTEDRNWYTRHGGYDRTSGPMPM